MKTIKILNLYACLGGNRLKWDEITNIEVTAVELDPVLAELYQERFPNDKVVVTDAHEYLLDHYQEFDFIWSSPPCPTHSRARFWGFGANGKNPVYPDFTLYQEIVFLKNHFKGKYVVENVKPYYEPLIKAKEINRHLYWTNFNLVGDIKTRSLDGFGKVKGELKKLTLFHEFDFDKYKGKQDKRKVARNMVDYETGKSIFKIAERVINSKPFEQIGLFK
tara:strand:+ start:14 stop:673 length:660 start_codon:yes stop_codon:yes gene_type:complete